MGKNSFQRLSYLFVKKNISFLEAKLLYEPVCPSLNYRVHQGCNHLCFCLKLLWDENHPQTNWILKIFLFVSLFFVIWLSELSDSLIGNLAIFLYLSFSVPHFDFLFFDIHNSYRQFVLVLGSLRFFARSRKDLNKLN